VAHNPSFDLHTAHTLLLGALLGRFVHTLASPLSLASMRLLCASLPSEQLSLESARETITATLGDLQRCQQVMQGFNQQLLYTDDDELIRLDGFVGDLTAAATSLALFTFDLVTVPQPTDAMPIVLRTGHLKLLLLSVLAALNSVQDEYGRRTMGQRPRVHFAFPEHHSIGMHCSDGDRLARFVERYCAAAREPLFASGLFWNIVHLSALLDCQISPSEHNGVALVLFRFAPR
jgi:hypothetical protein